MIQFDSLKIRDQTLHIYSYKFVNHTASASQGQKFFTL